MTRIGINAFDSPYAQSIVYLCHVNPSRGSLQISGVNECLQSERTQSIIQLDDGQAGTLLSNNADSTTKGDTVDFEYSTNHVFRPFFE